MIRLQIVTQKWDPISAAIRYSTRSWASHAEFVNVTAGETLGARSIGGVKLRPYGRDRYTRREQFTAGGIDNAYEWALAQIGKPYDFSAIAGIAFDRDWRDESRFFCSELIALAFEKVGAPILSTRPSSAAYRITPRDLLLSRLIYYLDV